MVIIALPGSRRKVTALVMQDVWEKSFILTGDKHACVCALAWDWADAEGKTYKPDNISRMIEAWMPNGRYREWNSTAAGLRQLWNYEGDEKIRQEARAAIQKAAEDLRFWGKIQELLNAQLSDYFPKQP